MNRSDCYDTKGKQAILFGNATVAGIILITVLFLWNAGNTTGVLPAVCFLLTALERMLFEKLRGD